jgi:hypothetical protein
MAKEVRTSKYKPRVVKPKKVKEVLNVNKNLKKVGVE